MMYSAYGVAGGPEASILGKLRMLRRALQSMSNSVNSKSRWPFLFRIISMFGAASLTTGIAWLYFWGHDIPSYARASLDLQRPLGARLMLVVGCVALIVAGCAKSGSKWLLWIS